MPTSKILDAYPQPPLFKEAERRSLEGKRRSADAGSLLGIVEDIRSTDPVFILRRSARPTSHRHSTPLDEVALHRIHRDSTQSIGSGSGKGDDTPTTPKSDSPKPQLSRQELIAAQRAASRANQRALLTSNNNNERGVDIHLSEGAVIRSSYHQPGEKIRYSYVDPDGEAYDISDIIEDISREQRATPGLDLVGNVLRNDSEQLGRVLDKIRLTKTDRRVVGLPTTDTMNTITTTTSISTSQSQSQSLYSEDSSRTPSSAAMEPPIQRVKSPIQQALTERARSPAQQINAERAMSPSQIMMAARAMSPTQGTQGMSIPDRVRSPLQQEITTTRARSPATTSINRAASPSLGHGSRSTTPVSRYATPLEAITPSSRSTTPTTLASASKPARNLAPTPTSLSQKHQKHASTSTVESEYAPTPIDPIHGQQTKRSPTIPPGFKLPKVVGFDKMWNIIEANKHLNRTEKPEPLEAIDDMLFGPKIELDKMHPAVVKACTPILKDLERIEKASVYLHV